jgi:hypothetical protein
MKARFAGIAAFFGILFLAGLLWCLFEGMANNSIYAFPTWSTGGWILFIIYALLAIGLAGWGGYDVYEDIEEY